MSSVSFEAIRLIFTGSASAVYTNLTANHESADAAADLVDQTARQLACLLIGPQASEAKELQVAGVLLDLFSLSPEGRPFPLSDGEPIPPLL